MINVAGEDYVSLGTDGPLSPTLSTREFKESFAEETRQRRSKGMAAPGEREDGYLFASDLNAANRFETLAEMLADKGYSATCIEKVLGRNLLRVFGDAWKK